MASQMTSSETPQLPRPSYQINSLAVELPSSKVRQRLSNVAVGDMDGSRRSSAFSSMRQSIRSRHSEPVIIGELLVKPSQKERIKSWFRLRGQQFKSFLGEIEYYLSFWYKPRQELECQFGSGIGSYFYFIGFLVQLNIIISIVFLCSTLLPYFIYSPSNFYETLPKPLPSEAPYSTVIIKAKNCTRIAESNLIPNNTKWYDYILYVMQGKGPVQQIPVFIGAYFNKTVVSVTNATALSHQAVYDMPLAWVVSYVVCILISICLALYRSKVAHDKSVLAFRNDGNTFTVKVFATWNYSQNTAKQARLQQQNIALDLKVELARLEEQKRIQNRTRTQRWCIYFARFVANACYLLFLFGIFHLIQTIQNVSSKWRLEPKVIESAILSLLVDFSIPVTITIINFIFPIICNLVIQFECYSAGTELMVKLWRTVVVRLLSVFFLLIALVKNVTADQKVVECQNKLYQCWETMVGQEFYRILFLGTLMTMVMPITVEFTRSMVNRHLVPKMSCVRLAALLTVPEFDLPLKALDLLYSQFLVWLGIYFCPILPLLNILNLFVTFYVRRWLLRGSHNRVDARSCQAARSERFFLDILLVTLAFSIATTGRLITKQAVSRGCSPFRLLASSDATMSTVVTQYLDINSPSFASFFLKVTSEQALFVYIIILAVSVFFYYLQSQARNKVLTVLTNEISASMRDRTFLLRRVQEVLLAANAVNNRQGQMVNSK